MTIDVTALTTGIARPQHNVVPCFACGATLSVARSTARTVVMRGGKELAVGFIDEATLGIICEQCDKGVARFALRNPIEKPVCTECDQPLGPDHKH
jgi:hypothetical protein